MYNRLRDVPRMRWGTARIPASAYNLVKLALLRLDDPIRMSSGLRDLDVILESRLWYCVDCSMNELPVLAWDLFQPRQGLHEPVVCRLSIYHAHAEKIIEPLLRHVSADLQQQLDEWRRKHGG